MTNVKLKLMFFLLNALLAADIVHARPYSNVNTTDIVFKFNSNDTFNLPVKSNADTLIVADETPEETERSSNTQMEAIMTAEQDRDEDLSKKVMKEHKQVTEENGEKRNKHLDDIVNAEQGRDEELSKKNMNENVALQMHKNDATALEQQMNTSSSLLEELMNSETDREEILTDILFRPESEFVDAPKFEFLIAAKINESALSNQSVVNKGVSEHFYKVDRNNSDVLRKVDYVELVEMGSAKEENKSAYSLLNITGHEVDNDLAPDTRFSDTQTLFLACFATLLPLLAVLFAMLLIRCMCRRWCPGVCKKPSDVSESDSSEKGDGQQEKSSVEGAEGEGTAPNGSIFTMTLKNNHLIVETEERHDIPKNGRETKMKYSPDNDGIFVVEVQQSTTYRPSKSQPPSPPQDPQISTNQALIHRPPEDLEKRAADDKSSKVLALSSTGLSISDLSMSSIESQNASYSYGSQMGYEQGPFGYPVYSGYNVSKDDSSEGIIHDSSQEPLLSKTPTNPDKPVVTAAIFKQDSLIANDVLQGPGYCIEGSTDGPLLSDVQAREYSLQYLHDHKDIKKIENGTSVPILEKIDSPKKTLNRADSLPVRLEDNQPVRPEVIPNMETISENESNDINSKEVLKGKRVSLPIIRTEVYESMKDSIKQTGSPKFEKLTNDTSPNENSDAPPLITITEESEAKDNAS